MDPPTETCATLADRILLGDAAAEEELVALYRGQVFAMAMARLRDREAARDVTQDVLWAVIQALRGGHVRQPDRLAAFICGTTRNLIHNYQRNQTGQARSIPVSEGLGLVAASQDADEEERVRLVEQAMADLDENDRRIVSLTLIDGLKSGEIAARLNLSADVVRQRKVRAVRKVIAILGGRSQR